MTHYAPDTEPDPQSTARPELFTLTFWLVTIARMTRGAAVGATAGFGAGVFDSLADVPWQGAATGCIIGAIMSLAASLANQFIPDGTATAVVARFTGGVR